MSACPAGASSSKYIPGCPQYPHQREDVPSMAAAMGVCEGSYQHSWLHVWRALTCAACGSLLDKVAQLAVTDEGALCVFTLAVQADVRVKITFIHICRRRRIYFEHHNNHIPTLGHASASLSATAAYRSSAGIYPGHSLVLTDASFHVQGCHEAIKAEAAILPRDVCALSTITDVWIILTFINI